MLSPADGSVILETESIPLAWEAAIDPDGDPVTYTVLLYGPNGDQTYEVTEPALTLSPGFGDRGSYSWVVIARDAYSPRTSLDPFHFTGGSVANENELPGHAPLTMDLWPNPTRDVATLRFDLPVQQEVFVEIVDVLGRTVRETDFGVRAQGSHTETISFARITAGLYVVRLTGSRSGPTTRRVVRVN